MKKILENKNTENENGRSMIEMLGVLAIIGVLSVGGIAGYSKAMHRYRVNKTIEQITYMAGAIRSFFATQRDYMGLDYLCNDTMRANGRCMAMKAKLVPDEMWESGKYYPQHVWGSNISTYPTSRTSTESGQQLNRAFVIVYENIPEEACIDLLTQDWSNAGVNVIYIYNEENAESNLSGQGLDVATPIDVNTAIKLCSTKDDPDGIDVLQFLLDVDVNDSLWKNDIDDTNTLLNGSFNQRVLNAKFIVLHFVITY